MSDQTPQVQADEEELAGEELETVSGGQDLNQCTIIINNAEGCGG